MHYKLQLIYEIRIAKWRIDDQNLEENREWSLKVFDRNKQLWLPVKYLDRPGEYAKITEVKVIES